jgi:tetratricopeptide (TPR) repeat protein
MQIVNRLSILSGVILIGVLICGTVTAENLPAAVYYNQGLTYSKLDKYDDAIVSYNMALNIDPNYKPALYNLIFAYYDSNRYNEALVTVEKLLALNPDYPYMWEMRGDILAKLGRYEDAIESYDTELKKNPNHHIAWKGRGASLAQLGRYEEALESFDKSLKITAGQSEVWSERGSVLNALGRYDDAIESFDTALVYNSSNLLAKQYRELSLQHLSINASPSTTIDVASQVTRPEVVMTVLNTTTETTSPTRKASFPGILLTTGAIFTASVLVYIRRSITS